MLLHFFLFILVILLLIAVLVYAFWLPNIYPNRGLLFRRKKFYSKKLYDTESSVYDGEKESKFRNKNIHATNIKNNPNTIEAERIMDKQTVDNKKPGLWQRLKNLLKADDDEQSINNNSQQKEKKLDTKTVFNPLKNTQQRSSSTKDTEADNLASDPVADNKPENSAQNSTYEHNASADQSTNASDGSTAQQENAAAEESATANLADDEQPDQQNASEETLDAEHTEQASETNEDSSNTNNTQLNEEHNDVAILYLKSDSILSGSRIVREFDRYGFRYNKQTGFYHRYDETFKNTLFCVANINEPGKFDDLHEVNTFQTNGLVFFLELKNIEPENYTVIVKRMFSFAGLVSKQLSCDVLDENGNIITKNNIDAIIKVYLQKKPIKHWAE